MPLHLNILDTMKNTKKITTARNLAVTCLSKWSGSGKPIQGFIDPIIHASDLSGDDRQLAVMLVMGVLRRQEYLDLIISRFSKTKLRKMKPLTLAALRVGVVQICLLDRIPDSAAVNETVGALKTMRQPSWLLGFVNAVLRSVAKEKKSLPDPETVLNHPPWLSERWRKNFGQEKMEEICRVNSLEPSLCLRANPRRMDREQLGRLFADHEITTALGRYAPDSLLVHDHHGAITVLPGFEQGLFQVQDQAAQLACYLLGPFREEGRYIDGCAGLGGKTCTLAGLLSASASLQAVEPDDRRVRLLGENLKREGAEARVHVFHGDLAAFADSEPPPFDGILIDAPCSGTGVIRRHPDIRWNRQPGDCIELQKKQLTLLKSAADLLVPGGVLVYATCSIEPEENQQLVEQFLAVRSDFRITDCRDVVPAAATPLLDEQGFFVSLPSEEIEGFFAARLVREGTF